MKQKTGPGRPQTVLEVVRVKRLPGTTVAAWIGETSTGEQVHLSYFPGELSVMVAHSTSNGDGRTWQTVVRCDPRLLEAEQTVVRWVEHESWLRKLEGNLSVKRLLQEAAHLRQRLWAEAQGPLRRQAGGGKEWSAAKVSLAMVQGWLETREAHRVHLARLGWLGGSGRVLVRTLLEKEPEKKERTE